MAAKTIVGTADFVGDILIVSSDNPYTGAGFDVCFFIEKYEPEYLSEMLGYEFYLQIMATIEADPENVPDEIADLINGTDYRDSSGVLHKWKGVRLYTAEYVYYWYKRNEFTSTTFLGEATPNVELGTMRDSGNKMARAFNESMDGIKEARAYLKSLPADTFPLYNPNCKIDPDKINVFGL